LLAQRKLRRCVSGRKQIATKPAGSNNQPTVRQIDPPASLQALQDTRIALWFSPIRTNQFRSINWFNTNKNYSSSEIDSFPRPSASLHLYICQSHNLIQR